MRKIAFCIVLVTVLSLALVLGVAAEKASPPVPNTLSAAGVVAVGPAAAGPAAAPAGLINDGSFENGPPPTSAWTEVTNSTCEWIGDWSSVWGVAAKDGTMDFWGGGYCGGTPTSSSVSQAGIAVPATDNMLHFWIISYRPDADDPDLDQAYLKVNGTTVWTYDLIQANDTFPNWVEQTYDLSAYAGQNVTLEFGANSAGASTGNIRFDFIQIGEPAPPPERCQIGFHEVTVLSQDFEGSFPPAGWNVVNNVPGGACVWDNTNPNGRTNLTGGTGKFAIADSDYCGSASSMDTEMWTSTLDLTGLADPRVSFNMDFYYYSSGGSEYGALDASTDNGATWSNLKTWTANARGPRLEEYAMPGAGSNNARVRWHYGNSSWDWWWQVDNVAITACAPDTPTAVDLSTVDASPVAPLASVPWAVVPAVLAAAAGAVWVARKSR